MQKKIIFSILGIIAVLAIVFYSQKAYSGGNTGGNTLISDATSQAKTYMAKGADWAMSKIYPAISGEVAKRGDIIKNEVAQEKNKVSENIGQKISNYFSGVADSILHPGDPQNCQTVPASGAK